MKIRLLQKLSVVKNLNARIGLKNLRQILAYNEAHFIIGLKNLIQNKNNEMCLVVSNKDSQPNKKKLSAGVIAAIVVSVLVVVVAVTVIIVYFLIKRKNSLETEDELSQGEDNSAINDYY